MDRRRAIAISLFSTWQAARAAQSDATEPIVVFAEHPRLFLRPQRLRLLRRERERTSLRWQQFDALIQGGAGLPEPGFSYALAYQVSGDKPAGGKAITWALGPGNDLRQLALVFDWCQDLLTPAQSKQLSARLERGIAQSAADDRLPAVRNRALAAIALYDHVPATPNREIDRIVRQWWDRRTVAALAAGRSVVSRDDAYPLYELLHSLRDTTNTDLREGAPRFFKDYPIEHLLTHYPASYPAAENEYRIGTSRNASGEPDLRLAALSRAAELSMVSYDVNAPESQVLQGWLMHDRYLMRGTFGATYEFLWANPYQPGLSYYHVPLIYHNPDFGKLFVRSSWEEGATWFGYFEGTVQLFRDGRVTVLNPQITSGPLALTEAVVYFGRDAHRFRARLQEDEAVFVVGLKPRQSYLLEVDDEEALEVATDAGGILLLDLPHQVDIGVRMKEINVPARTKERPLTEQDRIRQVRQPQRPEQE